MTPIRVVCLIQLMNIENRLCGILDATYEGVTDHFCTNFAGAIWGTVGPYIAVLHKEREDGASPRPRVSDSSAPNGRLDKSSPHLLSKQQCSGSVKTSQGEKQAVDYLVVLICC